jgi:hypothetical protein
VGQAANIVTSHKRGPRSRFVSLIARSFTPLRVSDWSGVGHPVESLSDMRRTEARSAEIERPAGVVLAFQVSENKVDPSEAVFARNLLSKDDIRAAFADEMEERRP